jgi:4-carboxymuconolactone decarboxylase
MAPILMARLPYVDPATAPEHVRELLAQLPPLNIFGMLAHAPTAFEPVVSFGGSVLTALKLDPKLRELAVLQVARETECEYEWVQHVDVGRHVGLTDRQIAGVREGRFGDRDCFSELEQAVLEFTGAVVRGPRVDERVYSAVADRISPRELVELLLTIGNYLMIARLMTTLELDIDDPVGMQVSQAAGAVARQSASSATPPPA